MYEYILGQNARGVLKRWLGKHNKSKKFPASLNGNTFNLFAHFAACQSLLTALLCLIYLFPKDHSVLFLFFFKDKQYLIIFFLQRRAAAAADTPGVYLLAASVSLTHLHSLCKHRNQSASHHSQSICPLRPPEMNPSLCVYTLLLRLLQNR